MSTPTLCLPTLPALDALVSDLDRAVRADPGPAATVDAVAGALRPFLGRDDLLAPGHQVGDPDTYRQHVLHVAPDGAWSLVALVWLPGQTTPVHDHVTWCVVGVHRGEEHEVRYRLVGDHLEETEHVTGPPGTVAGLLPPGDIHRVTNHGSDLAISLHVYGADLSVRRSSIRRVYDQPVRAFLGSHRRDLGTVSR